MQASEPEKYGTHEPGWQLTSYQKHGSVRSAIPAHQGLALKIHHDHPPSFFFDDLRRRKRLHS